VAILAVLAFHLGFGWATGGYLGVDLFFVLSGFLITSLLLEERLATDRIKLGAFWGRRARRLLPALFLVVIAIALYTAVNGHFATTPGNGAVRALAVLRGDALATLLYFANWQTVYFSQALSPLSHTWSLAIEEQFYLLWPIVIVALFRFSPRRWRRVGFGMCIVGALASAGEMAALIHPDNSGFVRIYYGTDTRAFDLLIGAAVAMLVAGRPQPGPRNRSMLHLAAPVAAACVVVFWRLAAQHSNWMYRGGFLIYAVVAATIIADVRQSHRGFLGRLLSIRPLRWIGMISYGLYLWHWPVIFYLNSNRTGLSGVGLALARVAITFAVATASYYFVERPIRRRHFTGIASGLVIPSAALLSILIVVAGTTPSVAAPVRAWPGGGLNPGFGTAVSGAGGLGGEVPLSLPPHLVVSPGHPLRVLTIGDTLMTSAQLGIAKALESTGEVTVVRYALPTWGLTRPGAQRLLARDVRVFHPQLVIGTWSADNAAAGAQPAIYRRTLDAAVRRLLEPGNGVFGVIFLQMPAIGPGPSNPSSSSSQDSRLRAVGLSAWNDAVKQSAVTFPGRVLYLPVGSSVELNGRFTSWLPPRPGQARPRKGWIRVRASDGIDLCPPGITRYTAPILEDLTEIFRLPAVRTHWWESYAVTIQAFSDQNTSIGSSCPDDHPT